MPMLLISIFRQIWNKNESDFGCRVYNEMQNKFKKPNTLTEKSACRKNNSELTTIK